MRELLATAEHTDVGDLESDRPDRVTWQSGVFFSGDSQNLGMWSSRAYTSAMALEALVKYRMGYDSGTGSIADPPRVQLTHP